jgi:DNA-binding CsgD family transcriptional regulator
VRKLLARVMRVMGARTRCQAVARAIAAGKVA